MQRRASNRLKASDGSRLLYHLDLLKLSGCMFKFMWRFLIFAFLPGLAFAGSVEDEAQGCMYSANPAELRGCLADIFYRRGFELDERIASVTSSLNRTELQSMVLSSSFESRQTAWRIDTDEKCNRTDLVVRELCRLSELQSREQQLSMELDAVMREFSE